MPRANVYATALPFFVPYWYPQIAVYDDLQGWANVPDNGQYEFYHEFADYDVTIAMPYGFQVWATGEWQNAADLLEKQYPNRWTRAHTAAEVVAVFWKETRCRRCLQKRQRKTYSGSRLRMCLILPSPQVITTTGMPHP